jgi:hypothetical protein
LSNLLGTIEGFPIELISCGMFLTIGVLLTSNRKRKIKFHQ